MRAMVPAGAASLRPDRTPPCRYRMQSRVNCIERLDVDLQLRGRTALITGGSQGIGLATAEALAKEGANVMVSARNQAGLDAALARLGGRASGVSGDVGEAADVIAAVQATE